MAILNHVISTQNELLTSGFRIPSRPTHDGADYVDANGLQLKQDVKILAFEDGVVVFSGMSSASAGMGYYIDIRHEFNGKKYFTRYCHFKSASPFNIGQSIKKGDVIGVMGNTGNVSPKPTTANPNAGTHLHFGLKENSTSWNTGTWVNPEPYLRGEKSMRTVEPIKTDNTIKFGDKVKISLMAVLYATGETIPARVKGVEYTVQQVKEDRVLLKEILSWVYTKDVQKT